MSRQTSGTVVLEYLEKYQGRPNHQIARIIYEENPELFTSVESARSLIRYYSGSSGKKAREHIATTKYMGHNKDWKKFILPEGDGEDFTPYQIPKGAKKIGIIADLQIPYHDRDAVHIALEYLDKQGIDTLVLNGDILDAHGLSKFERDPRKRAFHEELEITRTFLDGLTQTDWNLIWKDGNHEDRFYRYMILKAPELLDIPQFEFPALMEFGAKGITYVKNKVLIQAGHLYIGHGDEYKSGSGGVNPARSMYLKGHVNYICGHFHRTSQHAEPNMAGKLISTWSTGCLCNLRPSWMPYNKWNHGFALVHTDGEQFEVFNKKIVHGKVY